MLYCFSVGFCYVPGELGGKSSNYLAKGEDLLIFPVSSMNKDLSGRDVYMEYKSKREKPGNLVEVNRYFVNVTFFSGALDGVGE